MRGFSVSVQLGGCTSHSKVFVSAQLRGKKAFPLRINSSFSVSEQSPGLFFSLQSPSTSFSFQSLLTPKSPLRLDSGVKKLFHFRKCLQCFVPASKAYKFPEMRKSKPSLGPKHNILEESEQYNHVPAQIQFHAVLLEQHSPL